MVIIHNYLVSQQQFIVCFPSELLAAAGRILHSVDIGDDGRTISDFIRHCWFALSTVKTFMVEEVRLRISSTQIIELVIFWGKMLVESWKKKERAKVGWNLKNRVKTLTRKSYIKHLKVGIGNLKHEELKKSAVKHEKVGWKILSAISKSCFRNFQGWTPPPKNKRTAQFATLSNNNNNHQDKHLGGMDA